MSRKDWIPGKEQDGVDLMDKWEVLLADADKRTAFGWDPTECSKVIIVFDAFRTARTDYQNDDSSANLDKNVRRGKKEHGRRYPGPEALAQAHPHGPPRHRRQRPLERGTEHRYSVKQRSGFST
jgi:hypothetical protein